MPANKKQSGVLLKLVIETIETGKAERMCATCTGCPRFIVSGNFVRKPYAAIM
jgi:hypothetical protein